MSVDKKPQAQKYYLRPRRKSSGNIAQTVLTVHEGHLADKSGSTVDSSVTDMQRLPSRFVHSPQNGRLTRAISNPHLQQDMTSAHEDSTSMTSCTASLGFDDVFMDVPSVNGDGRARPVALEEELQARVHQLSGLLSMWKKRCQEQKQENSALVQQLQRTQSEYTSRMEHVKDKFTKQAQSMRTEITRVTAVKEKLEKEYRDMQTSFRKSLEQNKKDMGTLHSRWKQRSSDIEKLRELNGKSRGELLKLQNQVDQLKSENQNLAEKNKELQSKLQELRSDREKKNNNTMCSCMAQEYRLLFELALSKIQTCEPKQRFDSNTESKITRGEDALLHLEKDLENMVKRNSTNKPHMHYLSDSCDSCDSPKSPPGSPELVSKAIKMEQSKRVLQRKYSEPCRSTRKLSSFSFTDIGNSTGVLGAMTNIGNGHVTHPLDLQSARDQSQGLYRQRAFSEIQHSPKRHPMSKSYTTDDSRIAGMTYQKLDSTPQSRKDTKAEDNETTRAGNHVNEGKTNGSVIPIEICSDNEDASDNDHASSELMTSHTSTSGFGGLRSRRNGITGMPLDVSVHLRMNDVKKSKEFSDLLKKFTKEKDSPAIEKKFSAIRKLSRKKPKTPTKD